VLSVSRVFSFSPATDRLAAIALSRRIRPSFSFENFNYMDGREKGDTRVVGDWTAKLRTDDDDDDVPCLSPGK